MYDQPTLQQILAAVQQFLTEDLLPTAQDDPKRAHDINVAAQLLAQAQREQRDTATHQAEEWQRLNHLEGKDHLFPADLANALLERNRRLCEDISAGKYDTPLGHALLFEHLLTTTRAQLEVSNPDWLARLAQEGRLSRA